MATGMSLTERTNDEKKRVLAFGRFCIPPLGRLVSASFHRGEARRERRTDFFYRSNLVDGLVVAVPEPQRDALELDSVPPVYHERADVRVTVPVGGVEHVFVVLAE